MTKDSEAAHIDVSKIDDASDKALHLRDEAANQANDTEKHFTLRQCFRYYKPAVLWSLGVSNATIMESYMLLLSNSFYAQPQFQEKYGVEIEPGVYSIPAAWQVGVSMAGLVAMIIGVFCNGWLSDKVGLRKTMITCHLFMIVVIFSLFFAPNIETILVGNFLISLPAGLFAAATPTYAADVTPLRLRGYLTVYVNLCWVMGKLICFAVLSGTLEINSEWAYRIPFAIQWIWPLPLAVLTYLAPESPWWLVRKGRLEEAKRSLDRLCAAPMDIVDTSNTLAMIKRTVDTERSRSIEGRYTDCFRGINLRRTEISMISWGCQILPGFVIQNYITYFFTLAGLDTNYSFYMSIGNAGLAFIGTVSSWVVMTHCGWRTMYMMGLIAMVPVMGLVGFLDLATGTSSGDNIRWVQCGLLLLWFFIYGISIGPIPYTIAANVGAANLRTKTISLGRNTYYFFNIVNTIVAPYMLNPDEANLAGKAAFLPWALTLVLLCWTFFRLPELKDMPQETINNLFEDKVPARQFKEQSKNY